MVFVFHLLENYLRTVEDIHLKKTFLEIMTIEVVARR